MKVGSNMSLTSSPKCDLRGQAGPGNVNLLLTVVLSVVVDTPSTVILVR